MILRLINVLIAACAISLSCVAVAAEPPGSLHCYRTDDPVKCFVSAAQARLARVTNGDDRADAIGEMLYALSAIRSRDDTIMKEATKFSVSPSVQPVKQMDLLYALDMYASATADSADQTYESALRRFATLEQQLKGSALVKLYLNACSIIAWDDPFRERWLDFA
jgi:hypothetical protein